MLLRAMKVLLVTMCIWLPAACKDKEPVSASADAAVVPEQPFQGSLPYKVVMLADHLNVPWEMDVAKDGRIFFTERPGTVRVIEKGTLQGEPVIQFDPPFHSSGEGGLLGLALDPGFEDNHYMYVYHTYEASGGVLQNRVLRLKEKDNRAVVDKVLLEGLAGAQNHNGGRIKIGPDGYLYITVGDRYEPQMAQEKGSLGGKILRIGLDGSIPSDNPFPGSPVYSFGHRNPQGLAWHPESKQLYASEHGQSAHDEINRIEAGANYGWPLIQGDETSAEHPEMKTPLLHSGEATWAPSGMTFVSKGPWTGQLLVANLRGNQVLKVALTPDGEGVKQADALFKEWGRIRNVYEGPDGTLYIMTNNRDGRGRPASDDDKLFRLTPLAGSEE